MATDPKLNLATISFHTTDENKDDDTLVTVTIRKKDGSIAAFISDDFNQFRDDTDAGPFSLLIRDRGGKSDFKGGTLTLRIDPNGDDTWHFNFVTDLAFADGTHILTEEANLQLTTDRREQTFGIP